VRRKLGNKCAYTEDEQKQKDWEKKRDVNLSWKVKKEREREKVYGIVPSSFVSLSQEEDISDNS
jgi:hypothetical protein